jgi:hypothetical protein
MLRLYAAFDGDLLAAVVLVPEVESLLQQGSDATAKSGGDRRAVGGRAPARRGQRSHGRCESRGQREGRREFWH